MDVYGDDFAGMLAELEQQLDSRTLARALGVDEDELERIRAGHMPDEKTIERLRLLSRLGREADLQDPRAIVAALSGDPDLAAAVRSPLGLLALPRIRTLVIAFFVLDAIVFLFVVVVVLTDAL